MRVEAVFHHARDKNMRSPSWFSDRLRSRSYVASYIYGTTGTSFKFRPVDRVTYTNIHATKDYSGNGGKLTAKQHFLKFPQPYREKALAKLTEKLGALEYYSAAEALNKSFNWAETFEYWKEFYLILKKNEELFDIAPK